MHHPSDAAKIDRAMVSVNALRGRKSDFPVNEWLLDSGAFSEIMQYGGYRYGVEEYAAQIRRWNRNGTGRLTAAVAQDFMCEEPAIEATSAARGYRTSVAEHQRWTIERYDALLAEDYGGVTILPVLQGSQVTDYITHVRAYGDRLRPGMWVGVGSICKRQGNPSVISAILRAIHAARPDLKLHGFGVKLTSLAIADVRDELYSADSMAWSYLGRMQGRGNDPALAISYAKRVATQPVQTCIQLDLKEERERNGR